jgi:hypothetical protein
VKGCYSCVRDRRDLSENDRIELDAFERYLKIAAWRQDELGEDRYKAGAEASLEVYGDKVCEGRKHHAEPVEKDGE